MLGGCRSASPPCPSVWSTSGSRRSMPTATSVRAGSTAGGSVRWSTRRLQSSSCRRPSTRSAAPGGRPASWSGQVGASPGRRTGGDDRAPSGALDLRGARGRAREPHEAEQRSAPGRTATATPARRSAGAGGWDACSSPWRSSRSRRSRHTRCCGRSSTASSRATTTPVPAPVRCRSSSTTATPAAPSAPRWRRPTWSRAPSAYLDAAAGDSRAAAIQPGTLHDEEADDRRRRAGDPARPEEPQRAPRHGARGAVEERGLRRAVQGHRRAGRRVHRGGQGRRPRSACPAVAKGNVEGYLFPATYEFPAKATATQQLKIMVAKAVDELDKAGVERGRLPEDPHRGLDRRGRGRGRRPGQGRPRDREPAREPDGPDRRAAPDGLHGQLRAAEAGQPHQGRVRLREVEPLRHVRPQGPPARARSAAPVRPRSRLRPTRPRARGSTS